ncbi:Cmx/CmrA family chloramphenicol efflux MFS transporter [Pseudonocardia spinosispora]|uniref:Cmx/CmrA family chloramphenicol efflux MFS transporter n=1 Tax=Pseudonocardia spinosispora TaxID=103441 RepID=UPI00048CA105|nr:Cmx/CmrA family chloramphenicol efflux MFS transporter [Pseudonocardia spinosispora]
MPFAVYMLGLAVFTQGTSEFMLSGLVPGIARDMHVSIPAAGSLTSAFAVGMVVGAPLMALLSLRWPRRRALVGFLAAFIAVHILGALTESYAILLATRVAGALANAGFWATALATATTLVAPNLKGRATSIVVSGVTVACVAGVPAGALLGELWGWRSAFWAVALLSVPAVVGILLAVPAETPGAAAPGARHELRALRNPRLLTYLLLGALVNGATFCTFTYLTPLLTEVTGIGSRWMPVMLALFGVGSFLGVTIGGRLADTRPIPLLVTGGAALTLGWSLFALTAGSTVTTVVGVLVLGTLAFATGSTLISRVFYLATEAPTLAGGFATAAFNVGATVGPLLGGAAITAGFGFRAPPWVSALLMALALLTAAAAHALHRLRGRTPLQA